MIFQALAGRYGAADIWRHLIARGTAQDQALLRSQLAQRYGVDQQHVVLYRKGRAALAEAIRLVTGGSGEVAISGLTCYSVVQAVEAAGCQPVYVDIREADLQFGAGELERALALHPNISAVVIQNMLGIPADITALEAVVTTHGLKVIEDLAHSAGAHYADGREVGMIGDVTMLSFGKDKALDVVNGGVLIVRRGETPEAPQALPSFVDQLRDRLYPLIAATARCLYPLGVGRYVMSAAIRLKLVVRSADGEVDIHQSMPGWQARLAQRQVLELDQAVAARRAKLQLYAELLRDAMPSAAEQPGTSSARVPLLVDTPHDIIRALSHRGIHVEDVWYDVPVSPQRFFDRVVYPDVECPMAVQLSARLVNLPTHQQISAEDVARIAGIVRSKLP